MLHGSKTWSVKRVNETAFQLAETKMIRWMYDVILMYKLSC